ncbi:mast cell protease 1A-like protein [Labeo rohita]|uniref:Granzyme M n=1 Tax=Labeo rohita TaxID=84645 RepID=A0A498NGW3_LABRO|nr:mast cell protease 1A-like protein [Labeo rohita]
MTHFIAILLATALTTLHITDVGGDGIINGKKASKNSLQYMVSVQSNNKHYCGGFLISLQYVLTAAHCKTDEMTVVVGDHNISPRKNLKRYNVVRKFIPKTFKNVKMGADIMLLKISRKAVLGGKVKTVKFPHQHYSIKNNTQCLVAGWGSTKQRKEVNDLLALNVSTVDICDCKEAWQEYKENITQLPPNIICAGGYKQNGGVCSVINLKERLGQVVTASKGDSGGPLVCNSVAVGIVSFNIKGCKYPDVPNIYTDISKYARTFGADIINGKKAKKNSMLYMASVQIDGKHKCGGFLIHPSYVLTAAHCDLSGNMTVILGTHNISPQGANMKRYTVQNKHRHPSFENTKNGNDIMLLKLSKKLKTGKGLKTIKIPSKDKPLKKKAKCQVAGWGQTEQEKVVNDLLVTDVSPVNSTICQTMWKKVRVKLPDNVLCAGGFETKSGACQGDSGGPLVCSGTAVGIVSFNMGRCDYPNVPNVYTEISKYRTWIKNIIKGGA